MGGQRLHRLEPDGAVAWSRSPRASLAVADTEGLWHDGWVDVPSPGAAAYGVGSETVRHLTRLVERVAGTTTPARVMADALSMRRKTLIGGEKQPASIQSSPWRARPPPHRRLAEAGFRADGPRSPREEHHPERHPQEGAAHLLQRPDVRSHSFATIASASLLGHEEVSGAAALTKRVLGMGGAAAQRTGVGRQDPLARTRTINAEAAGRRAAPRLRRSSSARASGLP